MKYKLNTFKKSLGLSLVELMVAMTVSAILMLGISEIFTLNKKSYNVQDENARMQESGRYAFNILMTDIRRAGYFGGSANTNEMTGSLGITTSPGRTCVSTTTDWARTITRSFYGLDDGNTDTDNDSLVVDYTGCIPDDDYLRGDILVTRYTKGTLLSDSTLALSDNANRIYVRNSLFSGRIFRGSQATTGDETAGTGNYVEERHDAVRELAASAYYVGPSGRNCRFTDSGGNDIAIPALQREILDNAGLPIQEEVASGVEHIQFQYGVDTDGSQVVKQYFNADELSNSESIVPNWTQVITVRLWVLVRADCPTNGYTNTKTYAMGNITYDPDPDDSFKRQLYSTTVTTRN